MKIEQIRIVSNGFSISRDLAGIILQELNDTDSGKAWDSITLNFRDPKYNAQQGGYHPVEILISNTGEIQYITDFSYCGSGGYEELVKEIDFDFSCGEFQMFGNAMPISEGKELFPLWQRNFCAYYKWKVFNVTKEVN